MYFRSTTLAFFIFAYIISWGTQLLTVKTNLSIVASSLGLIPVVAGGVFIGNILFDKIIKLPFKEWLMDTLIYWSLYVNNSFWITN